MKEPEVSFEVALLLCEIGFKEYVDSCYDINNPTLGILDVGYLSGDEELYAPMQSVTQRYLRNQHNTFVEVQMWNGCPIGFRYIVKYQSNKKRNLTAGIDSNFHLSYEEALEEGLKQACIIIKNKQNESNISS